MLNVSIGIDGLHPSCCLISLQKEQILKESENVNTYGDKPFKLAVLHGGPGAVGYMKPVALELSKNYSVLEPLQSKLTVQQQIDELKDQITKYSNEPLTLLGSSWGAMLALLFTSQNQYMIKKLILVGCGTFTKEDSAIADEVRNKRFTLEQKNKLNELMQVIDALPEKEQNEKMREFAAIFDVSDKYFSIYNNKELENLNWNIFKNVWEDFVKLRETPNYIKSEFLKINVPVTLMHGDYDPHPIKEIYSFLKDCIPQTKLYELKKCGHYPWIEKYAKDDFYKIINEELKSVLSYTK